jgi:tRNA1(Val) A37 N6-methylase TrmN6
VEAGPGERVIEAGCGAGAALLSAALRTPEARFTGVERDPAALDLARRNIATNGLSERALAVGGDVAAGFPALGLERFDAALCNPPFFDDPGALRAPHPSRAGAWMADDGLEAWTRFLLAATKDGGRITVIHRADRLADLLARLGTKAGSFRVRPVQPFADAPAKRVLVRCRRGGKAPLVLLPALVLHERGAEAKHTALAEAILRGEAGLGWG